MALEGFSHEMSDAQTPLLHLAELKPHLTQEKVQHNAEEKKEIAEDCQPFTPVAIEIMGALATHSPVTFARELDRRIRRKRDSREGKATQFLLQRLSAVISAVG